MEQLIKEITDYCAHTGMKATTFGFNAANDGKFVDRIMGGGQCLPLTTERVRAYMAAHPAPDQTQAGAA